LEMALTALPPEQRSVIELAFFARPTDDQIAAVNSVPLGMVKGRARLGLRRLPATRGISRGYHPKPSLFKCERPE
jgi:DNA-directed RNA polymerase specialized sigma24 family protein